jgi:Zona pellucida-like domain
MEESVENEYIVTDENGCATDPNIFGDWEYNPESNTLMAHFNAFKFPSSDNIRFQCNIRVCFGKCQPVNCRGYNAYGRRKRREITDESQNENKSIATRSIKDDLGLEGTLREEITISSNAIVTFEKRDGRYSGNDASK